MVNIAKMSKTQRARHENKWCGWTPSEAARAIANRGFLRARTAGVKEAVHYATGEKNIRLVRIRFAKKLYRDFRKYHDFPLKAQQIGTVNNYLKRKAEMMNNVN
jgi:hypothetical protein